MYAPTIKSKLFYLPSCALKTFAVAILLLVSNPALQAQSDTAKTAGKDSARVYNPKEEIAYDGKRYRVYNNWLSFGGGANYNTKWPKDQKNIAVDLSFHLKQYYFRAGAFMSGNEFTAANAYNFHLGMGIRKEHEKYNLSAFIGPSYSYFKRPLSDSTEFGLSSILNTVYDRFGGYACIEAIYKIKYDVGFGGQIFCDYNEVQTIYGVRLVVYFSGAYRGIKYGYRKPTPKK